jgi:hypothetical protein
MTGHATVRTRDDGAVVSSTAATRRLSRYAVVAAFVGAWMAIGWVLDLGAVPYLLVGIPLTLGFQVLVARRPIVSLWVVDARSFRLDRAGVVIALGLAALPMYATVLGLTGGRVLDVAYGLVGVLGAVPAAFALRAMDRRARTALLRSLLTAGVVASLLFLADRLVRVGPAVTDPLGGIQAFAISLLLYVPMVFVIEAVTFRGALDTYARGPRPPTDLASAAFVSLMWGAWHLPLVLAGDALLRVPITLGYHLVVGLLLTIPWRRSGNLAVPGVTHAVIDAIRDGLAVA